MLILLSAETTYIVTKKFIRGEFLYLFIYFVHLLSETNTKIQEGLTIIYYSIESTSDILCEEHELLYRIVTKEMSRLSLYTAHRITYALIKICQFIQVLYTSKYRMFHIKRMPVAFLF